MIDLITSEALTTALNYKTNKTKQVHVYFKIIRVYLLRFKYFHILICLRSEA